MHQSLSAYYQTDNQKVLFLQQTPWPSTVYHSHVRSHAALQYSDGQLISL